MYNFPQGKMHSKRAPGKNTSKCPDCNHDIRLCHHTIKKYARGYRCGYCIKCKDICPSIKEMYKDYVVEMPNGIPIVDAIQYRQQKEGNIIETEQK